MKDESSRRRDASRKGASRCFVVDPTLSVDEVWLREWAAEGIARLEALLAAHAGFADFLERRDNGGDGDRVV